MAKAKGVRNGVIVDAAYWLGVDEEREAQQRGILLDRIKSMRAARWTRAEIAIVVNGWPADWREMVRGRF